MKQKILEVLLNHGMLVHPNAADHILAQKNPIEYTNLLIEKIKEPPIVLTMECLYQIENGGNTGTVSFEQKCDANPTNTIETIEMTQKNTPTVITHVPNATELSTIGSDLIEQPKIEINPMIVQESTISTPQITVSTAIKTKKSLAAEHPFAIEILRDVTGNSTTDGSVRGFTQYFRNRFSTISELLRNKRELSGAIDFKVAKLCNRTGKSNRYGQRSQAYKKWK